MTLRHRLSLKEHKHLKNQGIYCLQILALTISEHWKPEVKVAKKAEVKNLQDYETFMEVKDEGQTKVGS